LFSTIEDSGDLVQFQPGDHSVKGRLRFRHPAPPRKP
jgi:hypothetical protein